MDNLNEEQRTFLCIALVVMLFIATWLCTDLSQIAQPTQAEVDKYLEDNGQDYNSGVFSATTNDEFDDTKSHEWQDGYRAVQAQVDETMLATLRGERGF